MQTLITDLKSFGKTELNTIIISVFLSLLVLSTFLIGNSFLVFASVMILSFVFIWLSPQAGFMSALLVTMIFGEHFSLLPIQINETIYKIYALDFVLIFTFIAWFLQEPIKKIDLKKILNNKQNLWLIIFFTFIFLNLIISIFFKNAHTTLALGTFKNYTYLLVYFLVLALFKNKEDIMRVIKTLFWGGILLLGFVFYGWLTGAGLWSEITPGVHYLSGLHSYYLTFSIIILLISLIYKKYIFNFFSTFGIFLLQTLGMIGGMFRHLWLGLATAVLAIFNFLSFKNKAKFIHIGLIILLIILLAGLIFLWLSGILLGNEYDFSQTNFFSSILNRGQTIFETGANTESAAGWRLATWQIALDKFLSNPFLGIGLGQQFYFEYRG
ncbi:O-antigen ligase family protein, partial [Patescibacteria group bacterium]|nr:O-antigen ligase family protein [Patescibacteria group bacterium]